MNRTWRTTLALLFLVPTPVVAIAQTPQDSTALVVPSARYEAGWLWRLFWGAQYREAWTAECEVDVLDLDNFAGGLTPERAGSGRQTKSLVFVGADGRRYSFRSVDKDPTAALPADWRTTIAADILQDQISSQHPASALVADRLQTAAGVLHVDLHLAVMPDDPRLGEFRTEFAGMLGTISERPGDHIEPNAIFAGAEQIADGFEIFEYVRSGPSERVDSRAFLTARLIDILVGDWDRHRLQWRWAKVAGSDWLAIPEDRDQAFARLDGLLPSHAWRFIPELVGFREKYPAIVGLHMTAQEMDRRFLVDLEKPAWDSVAASMVAALTDQVIEDAVHQLPPGMYDLDGQYWTNALKRRRDALPEAATDLYKLLAKEVEVHATDVAEDVAISEIAAGLVEITIAERAANTVPYYRRRFDPQETNEVRIRMHGGDDQVVVRGREHLPITVRVIGGEGNDDLTFETPTRGVRFYDQYGPNRVSGTSPAGADIDKKEYTEWQYSSEHGRPPREWGTAILPVVKLGLSSDYGFLVGGGARFVNYGFRKSPYASRFTAGAGVATEGKVLLLFEADVRKENSPLFFTLNTLYTQLNVINWYGFGNDTEKFADPTFFKVDQGQLAIEPGISRSFGTAADLSLAAVLRYSVTDPDQVNFINTIPDLYGTGNVWQTGALVTFDLDTRDVELAATRGARLFLRGSLFPEALDVQSTFGSIDGFASAYLTARLFLEPTLALRAGGRKVWGEFPYYEAAFIGGEQSLRGWEAERFAGDASLYGNVELRLYLGNRRLLIPGDIGIFGLADAGRVWVDGASPGGWHTGYGGGLWFSFLGRQNTVSVSVATGEEDTRFYLVYGFAF